MKNVLLVMSSPRGGQSYSYQIARHVVEGVASSHPDAKLIVRDLAKEPVPHVGEAFVSGLSRPPEKRSQAEVKALALSDALIDELLAAEIIVLAVPMHNFTLPSTLKAWIDHVVRAGRTFAYSEKGPQGLVKDKKAIVVVARGGVYSDGPMKSFDFQESYLRRVLGFIGITDVQVVRVEGVALGQSAADNAMAVAVAHSEQVVRKVA